MFFGTFVKNQITVAVWAYLWKVHCSVSMCLIFSIASLVLISSFISSWSDKMQEAISTFLYYSHLLYVLKYVIFWRKLDEILRRMCILWLLSGILQITIKFIWSIAVFNSEVSLLVFFVWMTYLVVLKSPTISVLWSNVFLCLVVFPLRNCTCWHLVGQCQQLLHPFDELFPLSRYSNLIFLFWLISVWSLFCQTWV
jgi:hypothetical protein